MLNSVLSEKNLILSRTKSYLFDLESDMDNINAKINLLEADLAKNKIEIRSKEKQIISMESELANNKDTISNMKSKLESNKNIIHHLNNQLISLKNVESKYSHQLDSKEYCICCYKEKINDNNLEMEYLKKNNFIKKLLNPVSYLYLLF